MAATRHSGLECLNYQYPTDCIHAYSRNTFHTSNFELNKEFILFVNTFGKTQE